MLAQLVQLLYNVVDRVYIGHLPGADSLALTGIGLAFPLTTLIAAFTFLFGTGGTPLFSIARGSKEEERAEKILGNTFTLLLGTSLILFLLCYTFRRPVLYLFGASDDSYVYADAYLRIYLFGTAFSMLATGLNGFINAQGFPRTGMLTTLIGAVLNLILDPIFIFVLDMGVSGAALATVLSQMASCIWVLYFLTGKKALLTIKRKNLKVNWGLTREITALGISGFIMQGTNCLVQVVCNATLKLYGGAQPVLGYNYGAKCYTKVKQGIRFMSLLGIGYTVAAWLVVLLSPHFLLSVFTALGYSKQAIFFSLLRKVMIVTPLTLLLPRLGLGVDGVFLAEPISNAVGGIACFVTMYFVLYRKLGKISHLPT
ncbi:MAG: polysaccharide biosynthesis C-terminal domain-containing protein [Acetatifactor sp.]|nr:polysaccharide biosynthesis C-terminal domain-containing protein [Acetatifactor sp.]